MTLGQRLKELRKEHKLEQKDLTERFSLSSGSYSLYENDKRRPSYEILIQFADFYDISVDYLLGRTDTPHPIDDTPKQIASYSEQEMAVIYMMHEMDEANRKSVYDFTSYVYNEYKKVALSQQNAS